MEHNDPSRRQYAPNAYAAQQMQQGNSQMSGQLSSPAAMERFRQAYPQQSPPVPTSSARGGDEVQQMYAFPQSMQYGTALQYGQEMQGPESQRTQQQSSYQTYPTGSMYGMAPPQAEAPTLPPYEQVAQYRQRPGSASETLSSQFGVAQPAAQYYLPSQVGAPGAPTPDIASQQVPSYQQPSYPQSALPGPSAPQAYPSAMIDQSQATSYNMYAPPRPQSVAAPQQQQLPQFQYVPRQPAQNLDQAFNDYQSRMRTIFTLVNEGSLSDIHAQLLHISHYLLGNAEALGLTRDDETLHDDRIRLWDEYNRAWLVTLQRQHDMTEHWLHSNQQLQEPRSIMSFQSLEHLTRELVRLCDSVEKHGLVDYQMGVAEEEIMSLMLRCLALLEPPRERPDDVEPLGKSSATAASRGR